MGFFDGARNTKAGEDGNRLPPGSYSALQVVADKVVQGHHGVRRILTFRVLVDGASTGERDERGNPIEPAKAGAEGDIGVRLDGQYRASALAESNAWTAAMLGLTLDQANADLGRIETESERAISPAQPFRGRVLSGTVYRKTTGQGHVMTKIRLSPWDGKTTGGADMAPGATPPAAPPAAPAALSPEDRAKADGWAPHPQAPGYWYRGQEVKTLDQIAA